MRIRRRCARHGRNLIQNLGLHLREAEILRLGEDRNQVADRLGVRNREPSGRELQYYEATCKTQITEILYEQRDCEIG